MFTIKKLNKHMLFVLHKIIYFTYLLSIAKDDFLVPFLIMDPFVTLFSWTEDECDNSIITSKGSTICSYSIPNLLLLQTHATCHNINSAQVQLHSSCRSSRCVINKFTGRPRFSLMQIHHDVLQITYLFDLIYVLQKN